MSDETITRALGVAARDGCDIVNLSGGEPFILGKKLDAIVALVREAGLPVRISTSAYWATNGAGARRRIETLAAAGLTQLFISHSDEHAQYVPMPNLVFATTAARACGIVVALIVARGRHSVVTRSRIEQVFVEQGVAVPPLTVSRLIPFGRAASMAGDTFLMQPLDAIDGPCPSLTEHPTVFEDGTLAGCAGIMNRDARPLQFGSVLEDPPEAAFERMRTAPLAAWIHNLGVVAVKDLIEANSAIRFADRYANICHLCGDILCNPQAVGVLNRLGILQHAADTEDSCSSESQSSRAC
jgi:hypothetical protein